MKKICITTLKINAGMLCSITLSFLFFVFAPLEIYLINQDEFWFDIYTLVPFLLSMFFVSSIIGVLICIIMYSLKTKIYGFALAIFLAILIASYLQGTFLVGDLPQLDGREINWQMYQSGYCSSIFLWLFTATITIILFLKLDFSTFEKITKLISVFLLILLSISLIILCIVNNGFYRKSTDIATIKNQFEMSENQNFVILLFDAVDANTFSSILEKNPEYLSVFQDFTYYDNTMCAYPFTQMSIPFILSGKWYENMTSFDFYLSSALNDSPLLRILDEQKFKIGIYDSSLNLDNHNRFFDNMTSTPPQVSSALAFGRYTGQLSGIKYAPFFLKPLCYKAPDKINALKVPSSQAEYPYYEWTNTTFLENVLNSRMTFTKDKVFKFIHLEGAHVPYQYDKNVNLIENGTYDQNIEACITIASEYLNKLRSNNTYSNSVIIIMADHGYNGMTSTEGRQHPFLLVKGLNESHEMVVNHAPISYDDLQLAYKRLLSGNNSDEIFDYKEDDQRERRFLFYRYLEEDHMEEYVQHGRADDLTTLIPTGRVFER
jgi:hypothetical protein